MALALLGPAAALALAPDAAAFELAAGFSAVEEGDDRVRPGATAHVGINEFYAVDGHYYGREYGPVKQETMMLSAVRRWGLFKSNFLTAKFGVVVMDEKTTIHFDDDADQAFDQADDHYNAGATMGISWSLPKGSGPLYTSVSWDSHVFVAGAECLIAICSGRKQTISLVMGMALR